MLIIDDLGNNRRRDCAILNLPGKVNLAVLPFTPHGKSLAQQAPEAGKEVMLHAPMATVTPNSPGRGELDVTMARDDFIRILSTSIDDIPNLRGMNNHMGSALTQQWEQMTWVMAELRRRGLYFVDSRTSEKTVAALAATHYGIPHLSRRVFLDNQRDEEAIAAQLSEAVDSARQDGVAVAIGHPYPETITVLREQLAQLSEQGVQLALVSEVLATGELPQPRFHAAVGHELFGSGHGKLPEVGAQGLEAAPR